MLAQEEYKTTNDTEYDSCLLLEAEAVPAEEEAMEAEAEGEGGVRSPRLEGGESRPRTLEQVLPRWDRAPGIRHPGGSSLRGAAGGEEGE